MHFEALWNRLQDSLWFVPAILTVGYAVLAFVMVQVDVHLVGEVEGSFWIFAGSAEGARGVLTAIATSIITVTGVVFSVTIVALQLASTQFTPRVLRNFTADRSNQVVLGVFIGTFIYTLLVQRMVRAPVDEGGLRLVPSASVTMAVLLALASIGFLIFFINHAARSVQASVIIHRVTDETLETIRRIFDGESPPAAGEEVSQAQAGFVTAGQSGYVQGIDTKALTRIATAEELLIELRPRIGDWVLPGSTLAALWPAGTAESVAEDIRSAFVLGNERTPHQDPAFGVLELVDIAVKALSPGINDPTTAKICLDHLSQILLEWSRHAPPQTAYRDDDGTLRLIVPMLSFGEIVELAFGQVRHFGAAHPGFTIELIETMARVGALLPRRHAVQIGRHIAAALREATLQDHEEGDRRRICDAGRGALAAIRVAPRDHGRDARSVRERAAPPPG